MTTANELELHEILARANRQRTKKERAEILQKYDSVLLKTVLTGNFSESIQFRIPEGLPPGIKIPENIKAKKLPEEFLPEFPTWLKSNNPNQPSMQETLRKFLYCLGQVGTENAKVLLAMKDKKLEELYPNLTLEIVQMAYNPTEE